MKVWTLLLLFATASYQFEMKCKFERQGWDDAIGAAYTCAVQHLNLTKPKQEITSLIGQHPDNNTHDKVNTILIYEQTCEYFPAGIEKYFNGMEGIAVQKSGLKRITKQNLRPFGALKTISLYGNKLETLESNLFVYNKKLKFISIFNNNLKHIFGNVLDLQHLQRVYLSHNPCISEEASTPEKIEQLKCKLSESCPVTENMLELAEMEDEKLALEVEHLKLKESLDAITKNFVSHKRQLEQSQENYEKLKINKLESSGKENLTIVTIELEECQAEKFELMELIQELEVIEIVCASSSNSTSRECKTVGMKVLKAQIRVVNVKSKLKNPLRTETFTELDISGQHTLFLPLNVSTFFPTLKKLTVKSSELIIISEQAFEGFPDLVEVNFANNKLSEITNGNFKYLNGLLKLDLSSNRIEVINVGSFRNLIVLVELRLDSNLLFKLSSKLFETNKNLKVLTLNQNRLRQIPSNLFDLCCKQIQFADFSSNECVDSNFPEISLDLLKEEFIANCSIEVMLECRFGQENSSYTCLAENVFIDTKNAKVIGIKGEHTFGMTNDKVTVLKIINQTMEFMPRSFANFLPNLKTLWIESSKLQEMKKDRLAGLDRIIDLKVIRNNIEDIASGTFDDNENLQNLDLSFNSIENLPGESFAKLVNIKSISLSHNKLKALANDIIASQNTIEKFIFDQNSLSSIDPQIIKKLRVAKLIDFNGNECIDSKFDEAEHNEKKVMEIFGEISFKCLRD